MHSKETANSFLRVFLHILFKRKLFIIIFFAVTILISGIFAIRMKPTYMADSQIMIKMGREHVFMPTSTDVGGRPFLSFSSLEQINSEIELIKSRPLIENVVEVLGPWTIYKDLIDSDADAGENDTGFFTGLITALSDFLHSLFDSEQKERLEEHLTGERAGLSDHEKAVLRVQGKLEVSSIRNSRIIEISFQHEDPQIAATVVKNLVAAYLDKRPHVHKSPESYEFFQEQSNLLKTRIRETEEKLKKFKKEHNVVDLEEERSILLQKKADLQARMNESKSQQVETQKRISEISEQLESTPKKIQQGETTNLNALLINTLEERLVALEIKERELLAKYTESNHLVQDVKKQLKIVRDKLAEQETKRYGAASFGPNETYQRLKEDLFRNEAELEAINVKITSQRTHLAEYAERLDNLNAVENVIKELQDELEVDKENYQLYLTKHEESRISSEMDSKKIANVSVINTAQPPLNPMVNKAILCLAVGLLFAVFGSVGLAIFLEFLNEDLERPEDIEELLGAPVLASVPRERH
ncbi:MAG: GumC family protein [Desulfobacterales bacterium]|jgi:uncharacterized protein involved in exopolysaccharide biosynthesis